MTPAPAVPHVSVASWSLPHALAREVVVPIGSDLVVLGGVSAGGTTSSVFVIDTATGAGRAGGSLASAVHDAAGAAIDGRAVVFGGGASTTTDVVQEPGRVVGHLPARRADVSAAAAGGVVYVVGGYDGTTLVSDVLATTDGTTFRVVARLPVPVRYPAVAATGGKLFVVGGATSGGENAGVDTNAVQVVDLTSGAASVLARMPQTRSHATAVTIDGRVFVLGGHVAGRWSDDVSELDPATGVLHTVARLPRPLSDAGGAVIGSRAYLVGGEVAPSSYVTGTVVVALG